MGYYVTEVGNDQMVKELEALLPVSHDQVIATSIMFLIGAIGGAISFWRKRRAGEARPFNLSELIGELTVSGFVGVGTFWVMTGLHINPWFTAAAVGICGHMGTRVIFLAEKWLEHRMHIKLDQAPREPPQTRHDERRRVRK